MFFRWWDGKRPLSQGGLDWAVLCHAVADGGQNIGFWFGFSVFRCVRNLAEKSFAEVHHVVSQCAPQGHACDLVKAAYGQRRQPAIGS